MLAARTADIIPFPTRKTAEISPGDRLTQALTGLNVALAEQRAAIAAWRHSLTELRGVVNGVGEGLTTFQASLGRLETDVTALNSDAQAMEDWADAVLVQEVAPKG